VDNPTKVLIWLSCELRDRGRDQLGFGNWDVAERGGLLNTKEVIRCSRTHDQPRSPRPKGRAISNLSGLQDASLVEHTRRKGVGPMCMGMGMVWVPAWRP
jgi:hypothetical protein